MSNRNAKCSCGSGKRSKHCCGLLSAQDVHEDVVAALANASAVPPVIGAPEIVILVHGTFARSAPWTLSDSEMACTYQRALPGCEVKSFQWTGDNDHLARIAAGEELAKEVTRLQDAEVRPRLHIVAHSHGGNVALYALSAMPAGAVASLTCLGTPFLHLKLHPKLNELAAAGAAIASWGAALVAFFFAIWLASLIIPPSDGWPYLVEIAALAVAAFLLARATYQKVSVASEAALLLKLNAAWNTARRLRTKRPDCPMFVATVSGDEAGLLLNSFDIVASTPRSLLKLSTETMSAMLIGSIIVLPISLILTWLATPFIQEQTVTRIAIATVDPFGIIFLLALFVFVVSEALAPAATAFYAAVRTRWIAFGGESPYFAAVARIRPRAFPQWELPAGSVTRHYRRDPTLRGLSHSTLYEDVRVLRDIENWTLRRSAASAALSQSQGSKKATFKVPWPLVMATMLVSLTMSLLCFFDEPLFRSVFGRFIFW